MATKKYNGAPFGTQTSRSGFILFSFVSIHDFHFKRTRTKHNFHLSSSYPFHPCRFDISGVHPQSKMPGTFTQVPYCKKSEMVSCSCKPHHYFKSMMRYKNSIAVHDRGVVITTGRSHHYMGRSHHCMGRSHHYMGRSHRYMGRSHRYMGRSHHYMSRSHHYMGRSHRYMSRSHRYMGQSKQRYTVQSVYGSMNSK